MHYDHCKWVIDPQVTRPIVFAYPSGVASERIAVWCAERFPLLPTGLAYDIVVAQDYIRARNWTIVNCCLPGGKHLSPGITNFLFIDNDITPSVMSDAMFEVKADVVGCSHPQPSPTAWIYPDQFHSGFWRTNQASLMKMQGPWFDMVRSPNYDEILACDCEYFRRKALAAGLTIAHAGFAEHSNAQTWCGAN